MKKLLVASAAAGLMAVAAHAQTAPAEAGTVVHGGAFLADLLHPERHDAHHPGSDQRRDLHRGLDNQ